jgi:hypothetical protein
VTPVYKAGISGLFKPFADLIDNDLLIAKPVILGATGGSAGELAVLLRSQAPCEIADGNRAGYQHQFGGTLPVHSDPSRTSTSPPTSCAWPLAEDNARRGPADMAILRRTGAASPYSRFHRQK